MGNDIKKYLIKRGVTSSGVMASIASTATELNDILAMPLKKGFALDATTTLQLHAMNPKKGARIGRITTTRTPATRHKDSLDRLIQADPG